MSSLLIGKNDLFENPSSRVPICLCLDVSGSMAGNPISELNRGVQLFFDAIRDDITAKYSAEICIVTFGGNVEKKLDFASISRQQTPYLTAYGSTPMGEAVNEGLDLLQRRKEEYSRAGVNYFQPWMILMTDGIPTSDEYTLNTAINRTTNLINNKKLTLLPIGIGTEPDMMLLNRFSGNKGAYSLNGLNFKEFFEFLSKSICEVSSKSPSDSYDLFDHVEKSTSSWIK